MATPDKEKINPVDEYIQQANDYTNQANDYRAQGATIDSQLQKMPDFDYNKFYDEWKTGNKPVVDILSSYYKKPEQEINPEQEQKAKFGSALTDSLSSLAEMAASGKGAYVRNRGNEPTSTQTTNARLQAIKDKYDQNLLNYNSVTGNAAMQDFNQQLESAMNARGQKRQYLLYKAKELQDNAKQSNKDAFAARKDAADYQLKLEEQGLKGKELDQKMKEFRAKQQVDWYNAKTNRIKVTEDNKNENLVIPVPAHPNDPNATINPITNQRIANIPIKKKDIDAYYTRAMNDKNFFIKHPTLRTGNGVIVPFKDADKSAIAITQAQDEYNSQFAPKEQQKPTVTWKLPLMQEGNKQTKTISNF